MMSKERLEEIKQDVKMTRKDLAVSPSNEMTLHMDIMLNSMDYLIEQAERVQELEEIEMKVNDGRENADYYRKMAWKFNESNRRYKQVLEFYAEPDNYEWEITYRPQAEIDCMVIDDGGYMARKALEESK